jgi:hypothetical protein
MSTPSDIKPGSASAHIFWLLYGEPGIMKTRDIVGTLPGNVLIIKPPTDHIDSMRPADRGRVKVWQASDWDDLDRIEDYLRTEEAGKKWDWVAYDSLSLLQDFTLDDELETEINQISKNPNRKLFGPDQSVYGRNMFKIGAHLRHVIGPDQFNVLVVCHVSTEPLPSPDQDDEGDPVPKLMPWIQGKNMSPKICGYMKMVTLMGQNKNGRRFLRTQSNQYFYAKDQFHIAPDGVLWDPTAPKVLALINKSRGTSAKSTSRPAKKVARRVTRKGR